MGLDAVEASMQLTTTVRVVASLIDLDSETYGSSRGLW